MARALWMVYDGNEGLAKAWQLSGLFSVLGILMMVCMVVMICAKGPEGKKKDKAKKRSVGTWKAGSPRTLRANNTDIGNVATIGALTSYSGHGGSCCGCGGGGCACGGEGCGGGCGGCACGGGGCGGGCGGG